MSSPRRSPALALAATLAVVLVLAACTIEDSKPVATATPPEPAREVAAATPEPAAPVPEPTPEPELVPLAEATIEAAIAALEVPGAEPEIDDAINDDIDDDPGQVIDLEGAALVALLGEPGYRREEMNARVWQYLGENCVLDVYLYSGGVAVPYRVAYYEVRAEAADGAADDVRDRRCFRGLLRAHAAS